MPEEALQRLTLWRAFVPRWAHLPLSGEGAALFGGRWNPAGQPAIYAARELSTAWAEYNQGFVQHPALIAPWLVHEAMHNDRPGGAWEEGAAHLVQSLVTAQMLRGYPEQVGTTALSRVSMTNFLALFFNSRTVLESRGELWPGGSEHATSWFEQDFVSGEGPGTSPGSDLLVALLDELGVAINRPNYDEALVQALVIDEILDSGRVVSPQDIIAIAELLELDFDPDP
jgi:hypothetical protein